MFSRNPSSDPCYHSCGFGAIREFESINDIPEVDLDKCTGCGICVGSCPGLAIFVVDETFSETECLIALPYEFIPLPAKGGEVLLLNRAGEEVGKGKVHIVVPGKKPAGTSVIFFSKGLQRELSMEVRNVKVLTEGVGRGVSKNEEDIIVCRCEDITFRRDKGKVIRRVRPLLDEVSV